MGGDDGARKAAASTETRKVIQHGAAHFDHFGALRHFVVFPSKMAKKPKIGIF